MNLTEDRVREIVREELARVLPELLDVKEVARRLSVSAAHVYVLLDQQVLESVYIGRRRLVKAESMRSYMESLPSYRG